MKCLMNDVEVLPSVAASVFAATLDSHVHGCIHGSGCLLPLIVCLHACLRVFA